MKRFFKFTALSLIVALCLTGCGMKAEYGIKIGKDKKVTLEFIVAQDDEMIDAMLDMGSSMGDDSSSTETKTHTDKERWEYVESSDTTEDFKDYKKTKYDKDGYKGYTYTLNLGNIDDLVTDSKEKASVDKLGKDAKIFTKKGEVYSLNIKLSDDETNQIKQYASQVDFDMKLKVKLPNKAKSNNATKVEGTTYIWDLTEAKSVDLSFEVNGGSSLNPVMIAGAVCAVLGIGICVVAFTKKKNN